MATNTSNLHFSALRISTLHILRAAGFHSTKPSVLDTLVDITERYLIMLATRTASYAQSNHNSLTPTVTDVRLALTECGVLLPTQTHDHDAWTERLRRPLEQYDDVAFGTIRAEKDRASRDEQDTADVRAFAEWVFGERNREIRRVAEALPEKSDGVRIAGPGGDGSGGGEDFLAVLKRRNKTVVDEERWAGTVLGGDMEGREVLIEGGADATVDDWARRLRERQNGVIADGNLQMAGGTG